MSFPYIIWTMQRTGGTTLAALLADLSEYSGIEHEPFNPERMLGWVTKGWLETRDEEKLRADMAKALESLPLIKHCYELLPLEVNRVLMEVSCALGYRHIILDRRAEPRRVLSLELAKLTGAWGGKDAGAVYGQIERGELQLEPMNVDGALRHMTYCQKQRQALQDLFTAQGTSAFVIYFEDVYADPEAGRQRIRRLLDFLGIDPAAHADYEAWVDDALLRKGQNSARVMEAVPNIAKARDVLWEGFKTCKFSFEPS